MFRIRPTSNRSLQHSVQGAHLHCDTDRRHVHVCLVRAIRPATAQTATAGVRTLCRCGDFRKLFDSRLTRVGVTWSKDRYRANARKQRDAAKRAARSGGPTIGVGGWGTLYKS